MRLNPNLILRQLGSRSMIVDQGADSSLETNVFYLNEAAALLWKAVEGRDFDERTLAETLMENYETDERQALADAAEIAADWIARGLAEK